MERQRGFIVEETVILWRERLQRLRASHGGMSDGDYGVLVKLREKRKRDIFGFWRMKKMGGLVWMKGQFRFWEADVKYYSVILSCGKRRFHNFFLYYLVFGLSTVRQQTPPCWSGKTEQVSISYRWIGQTWYKQLDISFFQTYNTPYYAIPMTCYHNIIINYCYCGKNILVKILLKKAIELPES